MDVGRFWSTKPVIGMLHLPALPGSPYAVAVGIEAVIAAVLRDAEALVRGGCHALMMENFGDVPFFPGRVPAHVIAAMTRVACEVRQVFKGPFGINVLRNDGLGALAIAAAAGADFIRVNVLSGARVTDQGVIEGIAHELLRERQFLGAERIAILADVDVKHSAALAARPLADEVQDLVKRGRADAVVVSGRGTGAQVDLEELRLVKEAAGDCPVVIGSGATTASLAALGQYADGFIVGTALKCNGLSSEVVEVERVEAFMKAHREMSGAMR